MCVNTPEIPDREMVSMRRKERQFGEVSEKTRKNMQKIRSKDTSIEVALRKRLWHDGYRYRQVGMNSFYFAIVTLMISPGRRSPGC